MSHLTAPMPPQAGHHQKPYSFGLPRPAHPLTPPDTDYETVSYQALPVQNMAGLETEPLPPQMPPTLLDPPYASPYPPLHRKRSSVTYVNSGIREARERVVQRGLKWLVVVLPPVSFTREHGHLGHTLSSGPSRRLSNGLLMPLYPTLSGQLGAIAREYSFPSISGLCVYLHTNHSGISLTPRMSDESWPMLWNHLFDARTPSLPPQQLPVSGQIEFDIDLSKARWYESWIATSRRDYVDVPQSVAPSRPQSLSHWRADSQTSINEPVDDQAEAISFAQQAGAKARNIKKLSLVDRFDTPSVRSVSKLVPRDESPPSVSARQDLTLQALSPIVQEDEPLTGKKDIDNRVHSWRMSASAAVRSPLAATGQTSLDPANMPNTIADLPTASASTFELNLDDYTWSVSSAGPPEYDMESVFSWDRVPSVHMDRRGEGSVCLTPSVCTSFGPDDEYDPVSPVSYISRLPSPDLAWRMYEDVPPTPTTATSWGAPLEYPVSPLVSVYAPSIDIAGRFLQSRAVTPMTATSWGAPLSFPPSPAIVPRAPSPDIGERTTTSVPGSPRFRRDTRYTEFYNMVYPYYDAATSHEEEHSNYTELYTMVYPYYDAASHEEEPSSYTELYTMVYPYYDAAPQVQERRQDERMGAFVFPPLVKAARKPETSSDADVTLGYPTLNIYPAVYPSLDIYPALLTLDDRHLGALAVCSGAAYPVFDLYPAVYPSFDIYPATLTAAGSETKGLSTRLTASYPAIDIYPAVYPYLSIYPAMPQHSRNVVTNNAAEDGSRSGYPFFNLYPPVIVVDRTLYPHSVYDIYPAVKATVMPNASSGAMVGLRSSYPIFDIYPSVYPYSLEQIYPSIVVSETPILVAPSSVVSVGVEWQYPMFNIYPATSGSKDGQATREVVVGVRTAYPVLDIYPAGYPWSLYHIYSTVISDDNSAESTGVAVQLASRYPTFDIYPAVYPYNLEAIYPAVSVRQSLPSTRGVLVELSATYPNVCPFPPVYPYFAIYPATTSGETSAVEVDLSGKVLAFSQYPHLVIYPAIYPFIEIYPGRWDTAVQSIASRPSQAAVAPRRESYNRIEPRVEVVAAQMAQAVAATPVPVPAPQPQRRRPRYTHMELHAQVLAKARESVPAPGPPPVRTLPPAPGPVLALGAVSPTPRAVSIVPSVSRSVSPAPSAVAPVPRVIPPPVPAPMRAPPASPMHTPTPMRAQAPVPAVSRPRPAQMPLEELPHTYMGVPTIVAVEPSPTVTDEEPESATLFEMVTAQAPPPKSASPVLFEMMTAPSRPSPKPASPVLFEMVNPSAATPPPQPVAPTLVRSRSRSGTVSSRPVGERPPSIIQPPVSEKPSVPSPQGPPRRLSGLPSHPAVTRRVPSAAPRPTSTFGALPAVPPGPPLQAPSPSSFLRRQTSLMSPLAEERLSPVNGRSPQLPSPPEDWQRGWRTPTEGMSPILSLATGKPDLNRSKTMPTRAAPRGPRGSAISERAKAFDNPNVVPSADEPLKLSMSALSEFPAPPLPPLPSIPSPSAASPSRAVSKLDRSKYPFA